MLVAVGSRNPTKVEAVTNVFTTSFGKVDVISMSAPSGVSDMPQSLDETRKGAENRARYAIEQAKADYGVGIEGGLSETPDGLMLCDIVVIIDKNGKKGIGGGTEFLIPERYADRVRKGEPLGEILDKITGDNISKGKGLVGLLTKMQLDKTEKYRVTTLYAITPFLNPEFY